MSKIQLYQGDCLEVMKDIPDSSIDMVLTDPPYGTTACKWDTVIPFDPMWEQLKRIAKPRAAIVLFGNEPFSSLLRCSNLEMYKYDWYWKKQKGSNYFHFKNMPSKIIEVISVFSGGIILHATQSGNRMSYNPQGISDSDVFVKQNKNTSQLKYHRESQTNHTSGYTCQNKNYPTNLLDYRKEAGLHPTQKPVALMEYLIKTYSNESDTVLDFAMGSGTTGVACKNLNRNFIGIELDETYFNISEERIGNA